MVEPRRILMTGDTVGGVWSYALELGRALAPLGVEVVLATMGAAASPAQRAEAARLDNLILIDRICKLEWMDDPWDDVATAGDWLLELAARVRPDVVHLNGYAHGALPWPAPLLMVGHSDVASWFRAVRGETAPPSWDRYRAEVARGLAAADCVVTPTAAMLAALVAEYGRLRAPQVIWNGRAAAQFMPGAKEPLVLAAGRMWDDAKNLTALDAAAAQLSWPVLVAGPHEHPDGGSRAAAHVELLGPCSPDEMAALFSTASIYALPARYEPFGLSILEAALSGCALVLGDIASLRELWDGVAIFVAPDDVAGLRAALTLFIERPLVRREAALAARRRAQQLTPERMAAAYRATYRQLLVGPVEAVCA
jgi:glycogen(starch) synthase